MIYTLRRFHMIMRRTTPTEPIEPIEPIEPAFLFHPQSKGAPPHGLTLKFESRD